MRKTAKEIRESIQDKLTELKAMQKLAEDEKRDFTEDEQKLWDAAVAELGEAADSDKPATGLHLALEKAEKFERVVSSFESRRDSSPTAGDGHIQPVNRFRYGTLKAYKDEAAAFRAGQFLAATIWAHEPAIRWCNDNGVQIRNALGGASNTLGGALVPIEMEQAIIDLREQYGVFRREASVTPMAGDTKVVPRRTGGVTAYFVGENSEVTASDKNWDSVSLTARKLAALCKYSSELAEDAIISIGDDLTSEIAHAFANKEDECGFNGSGASTYGGIVGVINAVAAGSVSTAAAGNTAFSTLDLADFEAMVAQLPQYAEANAKWYISRAGYWASMYRLMDAGGGNTNMTIAEGIRQPVFLGYPVVFTQVLNSTLTAQTSTKILAFGDLRAAATMGNRRGIGIKVADQRYIEYDQLAILGTERFDIAVHETGTASAAGAILVMSTPGS